MFKPGQSGNPSGRKPGNKTIRELAKVHSEAALKTLAEIANNPEASDNSRVAACNALLDRAYGRSPQYIENVNLGVSYIDYLEMVAKEENEEVKEVEVSYTVDDL